MTDDFDAADAARAAVVDREQRAKHTHPLACGGCPWCDRGQVKRVLAVGGSPGTRTAATHGIGTCLVCDAVVRLHEGLLDPHQDRAGKPCPGTGQRPAPRDRP